MTPVNSKIWIIVLIAMFRYTAYTCSDEALNPDRLQKQFSIQVESYQITFSLHYSSFRIIAINIPQFVALEGQFNSNQILEISNDQDISNPQQIYQYIQDYHLDISIDSSSIIDITQISQNILNILIRKQIGNGKRTVDYFAEFKLKNMNFTMQNIQFHLIKMVEKCKQEKIQKYALIQQQKKKIEELQGKLRFQKLYGNYEQNLSLKEYVDFLLLKRMMNSYINQNNKKDYGAIKNQLQKLSFNNWVSRVLQSDQQRLQEQVRQFSTAAGINSTLIKFKRSELHPKQLQCYEYNAQYKIIRKKQLKDDHVPFINTNFIPKDGVHHVFFKNIHQPSYNSFGLAIGHSDGTWSFVLVTPLYKYHCSQNLAKPNGCFKHQQAQAIETGSLIACELNAPNNSITWYYNQRAQITITIPFQMDTVGTIFSYTAINEGKGIVQMI